MGATGLADAIARLETRYGARAVVRGDVAARQDGERRIQAGTSLDAVTGGGIRAGEPLAFVGPATSGKQALALTVAAAAQREGGMAAWIDPSASFDPSAALRAGVDLDRLVVIRAQDPGDVLLAGSAVLRSEGFRLAVVDVGPSFATRCRVDDLAPLVPIVRGSPAALLVVAEERGRIAFPVMRIEPVAWQLRFGRTVGWSFATGAPASRERALFCLTSLDAPPRDLGLRSELGASADDAMTAASDETRGYDMERGEEAKSRGWTANVGAFRDEHLRPARPYIARAVDERARVLLGSASSSARRVASGHAAVASREERNAPTFADDHSDVALERAS